ncbi:protein-glutamate O-methyltransferase CheR [Roseomonas sp. OT10]|uniref:CheR family methyltransferase n=1 Tax=Roseomonas cutis TaxID=2897332 RepID=UPI001E4E1843|nr:protein-glutamate O-methyltransferase CheR [Roseomonas sp. OT10]UFN51135.1 protein-glutamate O-methyltransferase CheR [Roseomonas sp. OT10]
MSAAFAEIAALVRARAGIVLTEDKGYMLDTRLGSVLRRHGLADLDALAARLRAPLSGPLATEVTEALTTNESSFFRDGRPFEHLRSALPKLAAARPAGQRLRLWSAACSTGQEAYSAAMILRGLAPLLGGRGAEILGTDLSREVVARAREGLFTQFEVQRGLPVQMLVQHFRQEGGRWRISAPLREMTRFEVGNLLDDQRGRGTFDVIFCRNVLIYFDPPTKRRVLEMLADRLAPDGVLYLGGAETVLGLGTRLVPVPGERGPHVLASSLSLAG